MSILKTTQNEIAVQECHDYSSPSGKLFNRTGVYLDTISNLAGCDSLITINLTINGRSEIDINACESFVSPSGKYTWLESGNYYDTLKKPIGCDSIINFNLKINEPSFVEQSQTACEEFIAPSGKNTWFESGNYYDTLINKTGCDSIIYFDLNINQPSYAIIEETACGEFVSPSGDYTWLESGNYIDILTNSVGCDSIVTINLKIDALSYSTMEVAACGEYISPSGSYVWSESGSYYDTLTNTLGCDSIVNVNLKINPLSYSTIEKTACGEYISPSGKYTWLDSGIFYDTLTSLNGCDSIIQFDLKVNHTSYTKITETACGEFTSPSGEFTWLQSGIYFDNLMSVFGCDSLVEVDLTIIEAHITTDFQDDKLYYATEYDEAEYRWFDCDKNLFIEGANSRTFRADRSAALSVEIQIEDLYCQSDCFDLVVTDVPEITTQDLLVFPNPTNNTLFIDFNDEIKDGEVELRTYNGQIVEKWEVRNMDKFQFEMNLPSGIYFVTIKLAGNSYNYKIVKK